MKLHLSYQRLGTTFLLVLFSLSIVVLGTLPAAASHECSAAETVAFDRNTAWELGVMFPRNYNSALAMAGCAGASAVAFDRNTAWELGVTFPRDNAGVVNRSHTVLLTASDQQPVNGTVIIDSVFSHGPGYIVIYGDYKGTPGPAVGHAWVDAGWNYNVVVPIDMSRKLAPAYAILHSDSNQIGVYEFGMAWGADAPALVNGSPITISFKVFYPAIRD